MISCKYDKCKISLQHFCWIFYINLPRIQFQSISVFTATGRRRRHAFRTTVDAMLQVPTAADGRYSACAATPPCVRADIGSEEVRLLCVRKHAHCRIHTLHLAAHNNDNNVTLT